MSYCCGCCLSKRWVAGWETYLCLVLLQDLLDCFLSSCPGAWGRHAVGVEGVDVSPCGEDAGPVS